MSDWTKAQYNPNLSDADFKEIKKLYEDGLVLSHIKPAKVFLLCPVGVVGAGKTTVLKPLAEKLHLVRVSADEIRNLLHQREFNYNRAKELAFEITKELLAEGYAVAVDANCGTEESIEKIKKFQKEHGMPVVWVHIDTPEDFIVSKLRNYPHDWLFKNGDEAVKAYFKYKETFGDFKNLDLPYAYTFDTSRPDIDEQIDEAAEVIKKPLMN